MPHWYPEDANHITNPGGPDPRDYSSRREYLDAVNLRGWIEHANELAEEHHPARPGEYNYARGDYESGPPEEASRSKKEKEGRSMKSTLDGTDRRWVALESSRFVAANTDTLDDSHELAVRAHHYAATKTSTFTPVRSAAICEAFVEKVGELGHRSHRPRIAKTASTYIDFDDSAMYVL